MNGHKWTAVGVAFGLSLAGCTATDSPPGTEGSTGGIGDPTLTPSPTPTEWSTDQTFYAESSGGASLAVDVRSSPPPDVEAFRASVNAAPVTYARVTIDNRQGTDDVSVENVTLFDREGRAYEFTDLSIDHIGQWGPDYTDALGGVEGEYGYQLTDGTPLDEATGERLSSLSIDLYNQHLDDGSAQRLEKTDGYLASTETVLPGEITGITIAPYGLFESIPMSPGTETPSSTGTFATDVGSTR